MTLAKKVCAAAIDNIKQVSGQFQAHHNPPIGQQQQQHAHKKFV
jgi:hypothetical protein